ncbi:hypothetical protein [Pseudoduganella rhizocola]|uniref:hypothetical protein n=1 Tax=Pseudoduganella rhizocola TaxID=3382643 RepID=UPI0038B5FD38
MHKLIFILLLLSSVPVFAESVGLCSTDKLERAGDELRIFPREDRVPDIFIKRDGETQAKHLKLGPNEKYYVLYEGDVAYLNFDPHSGCTLTPMSQAAGLGVEFEAVMRSPWIPPFSTKKFVLATTKSEDSNK